MSLKKKIIIAVLLLLIIAQFFKPEKNQGNVDGFMAFYEDTAPPQNVKNILERACFDCHSAHTEYPWYNTITPINYWLASHVNEGKKHFDVSKWQQYNLKRKDHKMEEFIEMVEDKEMPLKSYTWTHKEANLSQEQINTLLAWAKQVRLQYALQPMPQ